MSLYTQANIPIDPRKKNHRIRTRQRSSVAIFQQSKAVRIPETKNTVGQYCTSGDRKESKATLPGWLFMCNIMCSAFILEVVLATFRGPIHGSPL